MSGTSFLMFMEFYEKLIFAVGKRMFAISPDRIGEKSDPNHGLERLTKYDYIATFTGKRVRKPKQTHRCNKKTMNISWVSHYELKSRARVVRIIICHECSTHMFC